MYAAVRCQTHDMQFLAVLLCSPVRRYDFRIGAYATVFDSAVDLHQVLIDHAAGAYVQVADFRVTHLSIGQTHILAAGLQLRVRIILHQSCPVRCVGGPDSIGCSMCTNTPSIQNHQ